MKKTLKLLTVLCAATICTSAVSIAANAVNTDTNYLRGDADGDGVVTISDVTAIQRHLADLEHLSSANLQAADVDGNGLDITNLLDKTGRQRTAVYPKLILALCFAAGLL